MPAALPLIEYEARRPALAQWAVVCGENEVNAGQVAIKRLRDAQGNQQFAEQMTIGIESLSEIFGSTKEGDFN